MPELKGAQIRNFIKNLSSRSNINRSVVIIYKEKEPRKSAVKHFYKALLFTYRKELTPFVQKKGSILLYQTFAFLMVEATGLAPLAARPAKRLSIVCFAVEWVV